MEHKTLVVIPAHNEAKAIGDVLRGLAAAGVGEYADILVVNDASTDDTAAIAAACGATVLDHVFNLGYGCALQSGYKYAAGKGYEYVIQMDADGQHDVCNVRTLYEALREPCEDFEGRLPDIVIGSRFFISSVGFPISGVKKFAIHLFSSLIYYFTQKRILDPTSGLQGLRASAFTYYAGFSNFNSRYPDANMIIQMLMRGYVVTECPSVMHVRNGGVSMHAGIFKPIFYMCVMMLSILTVALREKHMQKRLRAEQAGAA